MLANHFIGILMAELKLHEHVVEHPLCAREAIIDHVLRCVNESIGLIFGNGGNVVSSRNAIFDVDFIAVLGNDIIFLHFLLGLLYLEQGVIVVDLCLAGLAKVEVLTEDALVANANDAVLVFAAGADHVVVDQLRKTRSSDLQLRRFLHLWLGFFRQNLFLLLHFLLLYFIFSPDLYLAFNHLLHDVLNLFVELALLNFNLSCV